MDDLWQQFHSLPKAIRDAVAKPEALAAVDELSGHYPNVDLVSFVMRVMVKEFPVNQIVTRLVNEYHVDQAAAQNIEQTLFQTTFQPVKDYLGYTGATQPTPPVAAPAPIIPTALPPVPETPSTPPVQPPTAPPVSSTPAPMPPAQSIPVQPISIPNMVPPPMPVSPQVPTGPNAPTSHYSEEDANEIAMHHQRLQSINIPSGTLGLDEITQRVVDQHHLAFHEEVLAKRILSILKARLKSIRNSDETKMMLVRGPKVGGVGLDPDIAAQVVKTLEIYAAQVKATGVFKPPEPIAPTPPPAVAPVAAAQPPAAPPLFRAPGQASAARDLKPTPSIAPVSPAPPQTGPTIKRPADIPTPPPVPNANPPATPPTTSSPATAPTQPPIRTLKRERTIEGPRVSDITRPMRMQGPAEEMRTITLTQFRRLGQGANESTDRLLQKFRQLESESFTMWAEALNGWRLSEVYQLYLSMGRESLEQGKPITEIIAQRAKSNQLYLSEHEFNALADMNRQIHA